MKRKNISIQLKIFLAILIFAAIIILVIWLFQIVFLSDFYRKTKIDEIKKVSVELENNIDNNNLQDYSEELVAQNNISFTLMKMGKGPVAQVNHSPSSRGTRLDSSQIVYLYLLAKDNGGTRLSVNSDIHTNEFDGKFSNYDQTMKLEETPFLPQNLELNYQDDKDENIYYTRVFINKGEEYVAVFNTVITPVNATVSTLRSQLIYLSIIFAIIALVFASFLSRSIAKPIMVTNESAKELAKGNVEVRFKGKGYKEISELNDTLNYAAVELSKSEALQRELIANVSHDLRTPLTMITGYAEVIRDLPGEDTPENLQIIIDEGNRLADLVNDMLDLSKLQAGVQSLTLSEISLTESVRQIMKRYKKLTEQNGYRIIFEYNENVFVCCDELKMTQVVYNLVNNAIHYTGEDKTVTIRQSIHHSYVRIEVIDTGDGIDADLLPYVWDRYYKIDKNHTQSLKGTGLGLSIVKKILELHGLPFGVNSVSGQGSNFWFEMEISDIEKITKHLDE